MKTGALSRSLLLALTGTACIALGQSAKPLWIDHLGMDSDFPRTVSGSANVENPFDLFFLDGQELIFSFDVNDTGGRMRTEPSTRVVTTVDTLTGSFLGRLRLPCPSGACRVAPTADGQLAVILGNKVEKLSRDFKEIQEVPIPPCEPDSGKCSTTPPQIDVTPGDKEIVLQRFDAFKYVSEMNDRISVGGVEWLRLKTADLSWDKTSHGRWSIGSFSAGNHAVIESEKGGPVLVTPDQRIPLCYRCSEALFLTDQLVLVSPILTPPGQIQHTMKQGALRIINLNGEAQGPDWTDWSPEEFQRARSAPRFVYVTATGGHTGMRALVDPKIHLHIHVFDWEQVKEIKRWDYDTTDADPGLVTALAVAISPDGKEVALLSDGKLMLYGIQ